MKESLESNTLLVMAQVRTGSLLRLFGNRDNGGNYEGTINFLEENKGISV